MTKKKALQTNFSGGEVSPRLGGHVDLEKYFSGVELLKNFLVQVQGGITRRPGTYFAAETRVSSKISRPIPFLYGQDQGYIIEAGEGYFRFYQNDGQVSIAPAVTGASWAAGTATVTIGAHTFLVGTQILVAGINPAGYNGTFVITGVTATTVDYALAVDPGAYVAGGTVTGPYEIATPYTGAGETDSLKWSQSGDDLYLTTPDYMTHRLRRNAHTDWELVEVDFIDGPYLPVNATATTLTPSGTSGTITVTASAALFAATDVGRLIRILIAGAWGYVKITVYTSPTQVTAEVKKGLGGAAATGAWRLGVWSATTGFPETCTFFQQRLILGGDAAKPQDVNGSMVGAFEDFSPSAADGTITASHAIQFTLVSDQVNIIRWMRASRFNLSIGTSAQEFTMNGGQEGQAVTPTNVSVIPESAYGSDALVQPVRAGESLLFLQKARKKIRQWLYDSDDDAYHADDMNLLADHITETGLFELAYQDQPNSNLWAVRGDGTLLSMTYYRREEVFAWARHTMGGSFAGGIPIVEGVASIPVQTHDQLWMIVARTINGQTKRYVEFLTPIFEEQDQADAHFVDCGLEYVGAPTATVSGLEHLEGEVVDILADGSVQPPQAVAGGAITLGREFSNIKVGLGYASEFRTMRLAHRAETTDSLLGDIKRIISLTLRFHRSRGGFLGLAGQEDELIFPDDGLSGQAPDLFSGDKKEPYPDTYNADGQIRVVQTQPLPMNLLSLAAEYEANA